MLRLVVAMIAALMASSVFAQSAEPQTVTFPGPAGVTLTGYLYLPAHRAGRAPAIVLMHGRAGPYSSLADGDYGASTLSKRHKFWGRFWADHGYVALLIDGFGPRGYAGGFPAHSYGARPDAVNEVTVRPLDAYAGLAYLRGRSDVDPGRIALMGWSNGGSATLATMATDAPGRVGAGFRGAVAFYPACGLHDKYADGYKPYAPVHVFSGEDDEEVSAKRCAKLVDASREAGGEIAITLYPGAEHDFDDPGRKRQSVPENADAASDAIPRALTFIERVTR
jgi:dienelactone hydrolase